MSASKYVFCRFLGSLLIAGYVLSGGICMAQDLDSLLETARREQRAGQDTTALRFYEQARALAQKQGAVRAEVHALLGKGDLLREAGALQPSLAEHDQALALLAQHSSDNDDLLARAYRQRAQTLGRLGRPASSEEDLAAATEILGRLGDERALAGVLATRSVLAAQSENYTDAVRFGREALRSLGGQAQSAEGLGALSSVAYGEHRLGRHEVALQLYGDLIHEAFERGDQRLVHFATCNRAEILRLRGEGAASEQELRALALELTSRRDSLPVAPDERAVFFAQQANVFDQLIALLVDTWREKEAFEWSEIFRSRSFFELLPEGPEGASVFSPSQTVEAMQRVLPGERLLVSYWSLQDRILVWALTNERFEFVQIPIPRERVAAEVKDYLEELRSPALARTAALTDGNAQHLATGRRLYRWLVEPIPEPLRALENWIVATDGILHRLPLEALPMECDAPPSAEIPSSMFERYRRCSYVGLERAISYVPSAGAIPHLLGRSAVGQAPSLALAPRAEGRVFDAGASPLPNAVREARRVRQRFAHGDLLIGEHASEKALEGRSEVEFLHLATHGWSDSVNPAASGIALAPDQTSDGVLRIHEILDLGIRAKLVTLASCSSTSGPLQRAEGLLGLARAFLLGGADAVVGSLWDIDDELSALLFDEMYRHLAAGVGAAEALRRARWAVFERSADRPSIFRHRRIAFAHPTYWGAFVVTGVP